MYLSNADSFEGFNDLASMGAPTPDVGLSEIDFEKVKDYNPRDF